MSNSAFAKNIRDLPSFIIEIRYILLFYILGDFITTLHALRYGFEENGFLASIMAEHGIWSLLLLKILFIGLVYYNYLAIKAANSRRMDLLWSISKKGIGFAGIFLVINNLFVIFGSYSLLQLMGLVPM
ncbi:DUF5658 family protein [uncultured Methanomethylovorans sp.]|uniref:DUF5658 family protein n=1 Tax=uncultured Methanomethylovorans sp. TaxID=183759 RepID=UPI002AA658EF|nr:DUF5658 family protein [uncultured Methanomethylovorans sp.]